MQTQNEDEESMSKGALTILWTFAALVIITVVIGVIGIGSVAEGHRSFNEELSYLKKGYFSLLLVGGGFTFVWCLVFIKNKPANQPARIDDYEEA